ncbi:hypothetical protein F4819DRAFT_481514 [Hypoxylon fuscum]|nr:hypothetical protein F4819DRAFT_481514 [Hypoxylon fuscum]
MVLHHPLRGSVAETNNVDGVTHETWEAAYAACHSSHGDSHDFDLLGVRELDAAFDWAPFVGKYAGESDFAAYTAALGRRSSISGAAGERRRNPQRGAAAPRLSHQGLDGQHGHLAVHVSAGRARVPRKVLRQGGGELAVAQKLPPFYRAFGENVVRREVPDRDQIIGHPLQTPKRPQIARHNGHNLAQSGLPTNRATSTGSRWTRSNPGGNAGIAIVGSGSLHILGWSRHRGALAPPQCWVRNTVREHLSLSLAKDEVQGNGQHRDTQKDGLSDT